MTAIPKCTSPSSINKLCNIGCTNLFSKVTESFVLDWTKEEEVEHNMMQNRSGGVAPTVITATVRIIREVSATAVKALPV